MTDWLLQLRAADAKHLQPLEVPKRYQSATWTDVPEGPLRSVAKRYGESFWGLASQGLAPVFLGPSGTGKTYTAAVLALGIRAQLLDVGWCACGVDFAGLDRQLFGDATRKRVEWLRSAPVVVMDGFTEVAGRGRTLITEIGLARFDAQLPTIWTGDLGQKRLATFVGGALARRLKVTSQGLLAHLKGGRERED